ncbi:MAG: hypothetical protein Q9167_005261 [Letrouitia subvulpina]
MEKSISLRSVAIWACCLLGGNFVSATGCSADKCVPLPPRSERYSTNLTSSTSKTTSTTSIKTSTTSSTTSTTATPTCTPYSNYNDGVKNGDFECGLAPWVAQDISGTTHSVSSPGDNSNFAYEFRQVGPVAPDASQHPASLSQDLSVQNGVPYNLRFRTYFDKCTQSEGFVGVKLNNQPVYTVDACDNGAGAFKDNLVQFFATGSNNLRFEFLIGENPATVKIDNVSVIPLH